MKKPEKGKSRYSRMPTSDREWVGRCRAIDECTAYYEEKISNLENRIVRLLHEREETIVVKSKGQLRRLLIQIPGLDETIGDK